MELGDPSGMGHRPARVGALALGACGGAVGEAVKLLLGDLAEAGAVYERLAGLATPVEFDVLDGMAEAGACEALVLGVCAGEELEEPLAELLPNVAEGSQVYAVVACESREPEEALPALSAFEKWCSEQGFIWQGVLVVADAARLPLVWGKPRMGRARRPVSEAMDELLLAIRCGAEVGVFSAVPRVPSWRRHAN